MGGVHLLLIDPQNDFADANGALSVQGAEDDMNRVASFIAKNPQLQGLHVTLDSHHLYHIANPLFWVNEQGEHPAPFTRITLADVEANKWLPFNSTHTNKSEVLDYLHTLEASKRYEHTIWPPHCLIGQWGHGVFPVVANAIKNWSRNVLEHDVCVDFVLKGSNAKTEHFSAIRAEVPNEDPTTAHNWGLVQRLYKADKILVAGIAGSHCVANTVRDLVYSSPGFCEKLVLLTDTMSPVPGCEKLQADFIAEMVSRNIETSATDKYKLA